MELMLILNILQPEEPYFKSEEPYSKPRVRRREKERETETGKERKRECLFGNAFNIAIR